MELPPHPTNRQALSSAHIPFLGSARRGLPTLAEVGGGGANLNDRNKSVGMISFLKTKQVSQYNIMVSVCCLEGRYSRVTQRENYILFGIVFFT